MSEDDNSYKSKAIDGIKWTSVDKVLTIGIQFVVSIILANQLGPKVFGTIALVNIFIVVAGVFIEGGFRTAIVRKPQLSQVDCSTALYFNIGVGVSLGALLCLVAPLLSVFFKTAELTSLLRALSVVLIFNSLTTTQEALLTRSFKFRELSVISIASVLISAPIALLCVFNGVGIWSIVIQQISASATRAIGYWVASSWKPSFEFSRASFREMFSYGSKLLISGLLNTAYGEITTAIIGRMYTPVALGYYHRANLFACQPPSIFIASVGKVIFPIMSEVQTDRQRLKEIYHRLIRSTSAVETFLTIGIAVFAQQIILLTVGSEWTDSITLLRVLALTMIVDNVSAINLSLLQVVGRSDLFLRLEVIKKTISVLMIICAAQFSVIAICCARVIYGFIAVQINMYYTRDILQMSYSEQLSDFIVYIIKSAVAYIPAALLICFFQNDLVSIVLGGTLATTIMYALLDKDNDVKINIDKALKIR